MCGGDGERGVWVESRWGAQRLGELAWTGGSGWGLTINTLFL